MGIKSFRPLTPTQRYKTSSTFDEITTDKPYYPLLVAKTRTNGHNNLGRMTVRHRGGGHKRFIRVVDFKRDKFNIAGTVETIEYDPNRNCRISLIKYSDGERRYILASANMKVGQTVVSGIDVEIAEGNCMPLKKVPLGTMVHNIEMRLSKGGQMARSAGAYAEVAAKENGMVQLRLPSSEVRNLPEDCTATIGQVSNAEFINIVWGSAGRRRYRGRRPHVRGVAMNPVDHPMGGGQGRSKSGGGRLHPVSPWSQKAKGLKTRKPKKLSTKYIVKRRSK